MKNLTIWKSYKYSQSLKISQKTLKSSHQNGYLNIKEMRKAKSLKGKLDLSQEVSLNNLELIFTKLSHLLLNKTHLD